MANERAITIATIPCGTRTHFAAFRIAHQNGKYVADVRIWKITDFGNQTDIFGGYDSCSIKAAPRFSAKALAGLAEKPNANLFIALYEKLIAKSDYAGLHFPASDAVRKTLGKAQLAHT